jgi:phage I-like protein
MNALTHHRIELRTRDGSPLPTEFRIFRAGSNPSTKGPDVFDAEAARLVMAEYRKQGVDLPIDLEHNSIDREVKARRSDATDAMGWFKLEMRGGDLWAVNVRWTAEGERRLRAKSQRYISPAFMADKKTRRVVELVNCALVAQPATHNARELVAASRFDLGRRSSAVLSTRVPVAVRARLFKLAARRDISVGELVRQLVTLAKSDKGKVADLLEVLGLPAETPRDQVLEAVGTLLDEADGIVPPAADAGATQEVADVPPAVRARAEAFRLRQYDPATRAAIRARGMSVQEFEVKKRTAVRRA